SRWRRARAARAPLPEPPEAPVEVRGPLEHASTETAQMNLCPPIPRSTLPVIAVTPLAPAETAPVIPPAP
ncbi:hypothetical protein, partial [Nocardia abscessus]|uniref:hypothetical protein n=1 Tax=Nocardia abscessus TaxID=120957 RepID=UPI002456988A